MSVDISVAIEIERSPADVAAYVMDANNDPMWIGGIIESTKLTDGPLGEGSKVSRVATFLGKRIEYVNRIETFDPPNLLVMRSESGPFPMVIHYAFEAKGDSTLATIRVQGQAGGFFRLAAPLLARSVKRNVRNDLEALKDLLESSEH